MDFEETASLSIVLSLLIHKISSKHDRDTTVSMQVAFKLNASHITRITFSKMSADFIQFLFSGSVFGHFDSQLMDFIQKYVLLFISEF